ncbi:unnamed protein product [Thelazia callipaeda]|uniref:Tudor domain-containing protein n=1 Tax=Thelazia callipaeda TaxID=103827 RepID=A0A0N5D8D8_THECL|nr:unnamed protein product [Thelazia callipaeda]
MVVPRWVRVWRVARAYPRYLWNNYTVHFYYIVIILLLFQDMPYYRNYYHVVRPDDPIAVEWRPPERRLKLIEQTVGQPHIGKITQIKSDPTNGIKWIYVEFFDCPSIREINISAIREALARWINEECVAALKCDLNGKIDANNILIGTVSCGANQNFITIRVLKNTTNITFREEQGLSKYYLDLDLNIIGKVIESREHLLSILLHSDLRLVTVQVIKESAEIRSTNAVDKLCYNFYCFIIIFSFIAFIVVLFFIFAVNKNVEEHTSVSPSHSLLLLQVMRN